MKRKRKSKSTVSSHVNKYDGYSQVDKVRRTADKTNKLISDSGESNLSSIKKNLESVSKVSDLIQQEIESENRELLKGDEVKSMHEVSKRDIREVKEEVKETEVRKVTEVEESEDVDETIDFWSKNTQQVKEMSVSQRVIRGMVFWYDVRPDVDKFDDHKININGNKYVDYVEYGRRPWVVVSNNVLNKKNTLVTIAPMASGQAGTGAHDKSRVDLLFMGRRTTILCEQIRTVTSAELTEYMSTLSDSVMDKVNDAMLYHLDLVQKTEWDSLTSEGALSKIEQLIDSIVKHKVEEALKDAQKIKQSDIDGVMSRISSSLESIYSNMTVKTEVEPKSKSQIDKFYEKYPELSKTEVKSESKTTQPKVEPKETKSDKEQDSAKSSIKSSVKKDDKKIPDRKVLVQAPKSEDDDTRRYMKWDLENMKKFIDDCNRHDIGYVTEKWGLETRVRCLKKKNYITHKLESMGVTV